MKIGLWADTHNFPNIATMKLSAYYKAKGASVEFLNHLSPYDIVYCSKVFDFTDDPETTAIIKTDKIVRAGTGYEDYESILPEAIEHTYPDYSLYPKYKDIAYGFLTRGCPRNCKFCCVCRKEGQKSIHVAELNEFWHEQKEIKLLDPNLLACKGHEYILKQLIESKALIDFTQGLDIRMINDSNIDLLNKLRIKAIHFAWDNPNDNL